MHLQLHEARDSVRLMGPSNGGQQVKILAATLIVKRVALRAEIYRPLKAKWEADKVSWFPIGCPLMNQDQRISHTFVSEQLFGPFALGTMASHWQLSVARCRRPLAVIVCIVRTAAMSVSF